MNYFFDVSIKRGYGWFILQNVKKVTNKMYTGYIISISLFNSNENNMQINFINFNWNHKNHNARKKVCRGSISIKISPLQVILHCNTLFLLFKPNVYNFHPLLKYIKNEWRSFFFSLPLPYFWMFFKTKFQSGFKLWNEALK